MHITEKSDKEVLCSSCLNADTCMYHERDHQPVFYCEEFSSGPAAHHCDHTYTPGACPNRLEGLCVDCVNRDTCVFDKPEGGVWVCEEYQ